jgi:hypothetical protein
MDSAWNPLNGLGYPTPSDMYVPFFLPYILLSFVSIAIEQYLITFFLLLAASIGILYLFKLLNAILNKDVNIRYIFAVNIFYLANYYIIFSFGFQVNFYLYTMLPFLTYFFLKLILDYKDKRKFIIYIILFSYLLEIGSYGFSLTPLLVYLIFILFSVFIVFKNQIYEYANKNGNNLRHSFAGMIFAFTILLILIVSMNVYWIYGFISKYAVDYSSFSSSSSGLLSGVNAYFTKGNVYPLKWLSLISVYPQLFQTVNNNSWIWIYLYYQANVFFYILGLLFFAILMVPLFLIKNKSSIYPQKVKIKLYSLLFILIFIGLEGINPADKYIYEFIFTHFRSFVPDLMGTYYEFIEMPIVFIYSLLLYDSLYELYHYKRTVKFIHKPKIFKSLSNPKFKKIFLALIIVLILLLYPFYIFSPNATQVYNTGHGLVNSEVNFPEYFTNLTDYINNKANGSSTLILPMSTDFLSMEFSKTDIFADDSYPGLLFGSPVINGENSTLFKWINNEIIENNSKFSTLLNDINVKYIVLNTIYDKYACGYTYDPNLTLIGKFMNNSQNISLVSNFGPLVLYKNDNYNGIIEATNPYYSNGTTFTGKSEIMDAFSNITTSTFSNKTSTPEVIFNSTANMIKIKFTKNTSYKYITNGFTFYNEISLNENLSKYHYLVIDVNGSQNNNLSGPKIGLYTYAGFENEKYLSSFLFPIGHTHELVNTTGNTTQLVYTLLSNKYYENNLNSNLSAGINTTLQHVMLWIAWYNVTGRIISNLPASVNITNIYLAQGIINNSYFSPVNNSVLINKKINTHNIASNEPIIEYKRISSTEYKIKVMNATAPFVLLFKQNYNPDWVLTLNGNSEFEHITGDYILNAWIVNDTGNYSLTITYTGQKLSNVVNAISIMANISAVAILLLITIETTIKRRYLAS